MLGDVAPVADSKGPAVYESDQAAMGVRRWRRPLIARRQLPHRSACPQWMKSVPINGAGIAG